MGIEKVEKVYLVGFQEVQEKLLERLQQEEIIHLDYPSREDISYTEPSINKEIEKAINVLSLYEEKKFLEEIFTEPYFLKKDQFYAVNAHSLKETVKAILNLASQKESLSSKIKSIEEKISLLSGYIFIECSWQEFNSLKYISLIFIKIKPRQRTYLKDFFKEKKVFVKQIAFCDKEEIWAIVGEKSEIENILKEKIILPLELPLSIWEEYPDKNVPQTIASLKKQIFFLKKQAENIDKEIRKQLSYKDKLMIVYDFFLNEEFKNSIEKSTLKTKRLFFLKGWILSSQREKFAKLIEEFKDKVYFRMAPPLPEEVVPTKLKNKKFINPFSIIVNMYGAPHPHSLDPTPFVAPFFFLFVGLCISDAGYGVLLSFFSLYILKRKKLTEGAKNFFSLLFCLGISTFLVGLILGGFFGINLPFKMIDILKHPFPFLIFCFLLGYFQVLFGIVLKIYLEFKNKNYQKTLLNTSWFTLLISSVGFFIFKFTIFKILSFISILGIIVFASSAKNIFVHTGVGLYELYGITKYFSDVLSYSRLLALGMATGVIAMVINLLAKMSFKANILGAIGALGILIGGHVFNFLINLMSGFIHSARLQFVEFFSKFFELGEEFFQPLRIHTRYTHITEE